MFDLGTCVYHYTHCDTTTERILPTMSVRMASFERLNDPREAKTWPFNFYARTATGFSADLFRAATEFVTKRSFILSCSRNRPDARPGDLFGLGLAHPRMWAQYADGHQGVCLAFDREELNAAILRAAGGRAVFSGPVEYLDSLHGRSSLAGGPYDIAYLEDVGAAGLEAVMEPHIARFRNELFFTKHFDWRDEWEYRWVVRSEEDSPLFVPIDTALKAVLVGQDCPPQQVTRLVDACKVSRVGVHRVFWHGWAVSMFGDLLDPAGTDGISLNGISFSTHIPCERVFTQACDQDGRVRTIAVGSNGDVVPMD